MNNKILILQRVCAPYRIKFFAEFQKIMTNSTLIIGEDIPNSKVKNSQDLEDLNFIKLKTKHISFFGRILTFHKGLLSQFRKNKPDIIICEAESHVIGYLTAIIYKIFFNNKVKLGYWCFIALPGRVYNKYNPKELFKRNIRKLFDHFFLYHSYGKNKLLEMGINEDQITIVTNVGNTQRFNDLSKQKTEKSLAKKKLNLENECTLLFLGTLDENKRPEKLIEIMLSINKNVSLKTLNTFKIDVISKGFVSIKNFNELKKALENNNYKDYRILGGGSNILFTNNFDGLTIHIANKGISITNESIKDVIVEISAGENWHDFVLWSLKNGYGGIENLALIPGNVGAAPIQNIGAYGVELQEVFIECSAIDIKTLKTKIFSAKDCEFGYRDSVFKNRQKNNYIITSIKDVTPIPHNGCRPRKRRRV